MKDSAIVPDIIGANPEGSRDIGDDPVHLFSEFPDPCMDSFECDRREIENRNLVSSLLEEIVNQARVASSDVDDTAR